jgi:hypothetical protein
MCGGSVTIMSVWSATCAGWSTTGSRSPFSARSTTVRARRRIPIAQLLEEYESSCARYRNLAASLGLDTQSQHELEGELFDLRYVLLHLIEETAGITATSTSSGTWQTA